jgi:hypothetical protein
MHARMGVLFPSHPSGEFTMEHHEQQRLNQLYAQHLQALKLKGKRSKTIDGYARAVRRIAGYFNRCSDNLTTAEVKAYFAWMVENYSWSSVKVDFWGLSLFYHHVLARPMEWVNMIKPPNSRSLPDIPTRQEVQLLINSVFRHLNYHPHVHLIVPAGALDERTRQWRQKQRKQKVLFWAKTLSRVFRAKWFVGMRLAGLH